MEFKLINQNYGLPFNISLVEDKMEEYHFHKELELVFILKGKASFLIGDISYNLNVYDLLFINSMDIHSMYSKSEDSIFISCHIDLSFFDKYYDNFSDLYFKYSDILNDRTSSIYKIISSNIAKITLSNIKQSPDYKLTLLNSITEIVSTLLKSFKSEFKDKQINKSYKEKRLYSILKYIDDNYTSDLSLTDISTALHITPQYISKFFKDSLGIGFVNYLNKLRISKSLPSLLEDKKSILDISLEYGFSDHKAYNRVFKKEFGITASEYRNNYKNNLLKNINSKHTDNNSNNYFKYLFEFINYENSIDSPYSLCGLDIHENLKDFIPKPLNKYWNKITSIGRASLCLRHEVRKQIETIQNEVKFEYIKFQGIFSDEMMVYREDSNGNPIYNWIYVDEIFDFFYRLKLKPFIEIEFMPEALASKKQYTPYLWNSNVSYPKSLSKWTKLVSSFLKHCINRFGADEVSTWYFQIWHCPEMKDVFWFESDEKFYKFFHETYLAIKAELPNAIIGSPHSLPTNNYKWIDKFLEYAENNSIYLDFISTNIYGYTDPKNTTIPHAVVSKSSDLLVVSNENFLKESILSLRKVLAKHDISNNTELFVTEWNLSPFSKDYTRDTCFLSSYITYNLINNIGNIDKVVFWNISDIIEEGITGSSMFHGGLGLFTYNSLKKPSYNAFLLLNKLYDNLVSYGEDYVITSNGNDFRILLFNFVYYDNLFISGDKSLLSYHNRYSIFKSKSENKVVNLILSMHEGTYVIKKTTLNRKSGSIFDAWIDMGAPENIENDIYDFLKSTQSPHIEISTETVKNDLVLSDSIPEHGILLIELSKIH